jgi:hypothetical protein
MKMHFAIAAAAALISLTPAHARSYYVVRNTVTNECKIVTQLPRVTKTSKSTVVVQNPVAYKKNSEARAALKAVQVCRDM